MKARKVRSPAMPVEMMASMSKDVKIGTIVGECSLVKFTRVKEGIEATFFDGQKSFCADDNGFKPR